VIDVSSPLFDPFRPLLARLTLDPLPDAEALQAALGDRVAPERFEAQTKKRARGAPFVLDDLYEARIARRGVIPTRTHVHDLMNALVWATFPRSKRALAHRQYRALVAQVGESPTSLPNARTRERDVLAMIDEGGLVRLGGETRVFGHAILEHLVTSDAPVRGFPIPLGLPAGAAAETVDAALAAWIDALDTDAARPDAVELAG
jgi:hypothetical protein